MTHEVSGEGQTAALSNGSNQSAASGRRRWTDTLWVKALLRPWSVIGLTIIATLTFVALFAEHLAPHDPKLIVGPPLEPMFGDFVFGTDDLGRDTLSQLMFGSRASLYVGLLAALGSTVIGIIIGSIAGYFGGWLDAVLMRTSEVIQILPSLVVALVLAALWGGSLKLVIVVIAATAWPNEARVMRAQVLSLRERDYVSAARVGGFSRRHILLSELMPNAIPPLIVAGALGVGYAILIEAGLSFIGVGDPNAWSWGQMLNAAQPLLPVAWWLSALPGVAIVLTVLAFNFIADGFNDALNPRSATRDNLPRRRGDHLRTRLLQRMTPTTSRASTGAGDAILKVADLHFHFRVQQHEVRAVDGVDLRVDRGQCVGIVGESGSGKSTLARVVARLLPAVEVTRFDGTVQIDGVDMLSMPDVQLAEFRRGRVSMVFQEPMSYLNPTMKVGHQIAEGLPDGLSPSEVRSQIDELLSRVDLPPSAAVKDRYPHELSGGQRQRVLIALALALRPQLLIADEPTTALDQTVQAQVLGTLLRLNRQEGLAVLLITHDLGLIANMCDRVHVMRDGRIVESGTTLDIFERPQHPHTRALLDARIGFDRAEPETPELTVEEANLC